MNVKKYAERNRRAAACQHGEVERGTAFLVPAKPETHVLTTPLTTAIPYPRPSIPVVPVFSWAALIRVGGGTVASVDDVGEVRYTSSGAAAIALALRDARIGSGDEVLLPAYHCLAMVEPVRAIGAAPAFYRLRPDLTIDWEDLTGRIGRSTRAILATHFFGFPQDMEPLRSICDRAKLVLIEDCAHAFYGRHGREGRALGAIGDYTIASVRKFFPVNDGGLLVSTRRSLGRVSLRTPSLGYQLKAAVNILEEAFGYGRARATYWALSLPLRVKDVLWSQLKRRTTSDASTIGPTVTEGYRYVAAAWMDRRMSWASRAIMALCPRGRVAVRRRYYYDRLARGLSGIAGGRPLYPSLPEGAVPYMFPFLVDRPQSVFPALKRRGVPIYRWEDLATDVCGVSNDYARRLFQLPCHPELRESEVDWMIRCVRDALLGATSADAAPVTIRSGAAR